MLFYAEGSKDTVLDQPAIQKGLYTALDKLGKADKVLAIPPDFTRFHSMAGKVTEALFHYYGSALTDILPALGTHAPMSSSEKARMFGSVPDDLFRVHKWREDLTTLGRVPSEFIEKATGGKLSFDWPAQVNSLLVEGGFDYIFSIGQVVPHEVIGMANYNKNIFVGTGGSEGINKSHFLGAVYGMERIMGRADNPVRQVLNYASDHFAKDLPIIYIHTVIGMDENGELVCRGLFIGDDVECFLKASELSLEVNFTMVPEPIQRAVVYLDPEEFKSTWLGNKAVYRTRMAIADGGELIILAPGVKEFGEDPEIDRLIRSYGYIGTPGILEAVKKNQDLSENLSAAAHLIHGSSEGRFQITLCPGHLSREEVGNVNFKYEDLDKMLEIYNPEELRNGYHTLPDGKDFFYISNPALGLWAHADRFH